MTEKQTTGNESGNGDRQWENATKRKAQSRGFVLSGTVVSPFASHILSRLLSLLHLLVN